jgi:hypothetical protein
MSTKIQYMGENNSKSYGKIAIRETLWAYTLTPE